MQNNRFEDMDFCVLLATSITPTCQFDSACFSGKDDTRVDTLGARCQRSG